MCRFRRTRKGRALRPKADSTALNGAILRAKEGLFMARFTLCFILLAAALGHAVQPLATTDGSVSGSNLMVLNSQWRPADSYRWQRLNLQMTSRSPVPTKASATRFALTFSSATTTTRLSLSGAQPVDRVSLMPRMPSGRREDWFPPIESGVTLLLWKSARPERTSQKCASRPPYKKTAGQKMSYCSLYLSVRCFQYGERILAPKAPLL